MSVNLDLRQNGPDVTFPLSVHPRASRDEVVGVQNGALKLRVAAPPVEGEANEACLRFLAKTLGLSRSRLEIVKGERSRHKVIRVKNVQVEDLLERLSTLERP
ncbi:MAG: YggU family protein [candidate division NC10 bacterium]|nr:YggU family protein [candidate division NC10 bacterium]